MAFFLEYKDARFHVDKKYREMGYARARELIEFYTSAEIITFSDRTKLSEFLNLVYKLDRDIKQEKRKANKLKKEKIKNDKIYKRIGKSKNTIEIG